MRVLIAGSSGLIGSALTEALEQRQVEVVRLVRRAPQSPQERWWDPSNGSIDPDALDGVDAVVNLAGAGIADRPWTKKYQQQLVLSRLTSTRTLVAALEQSPVGRFLSASAIGYYGAHCGDTELTEESPVGTGFLAGLCQAWENAATPFASTALLRTGNVLTNRGGFLGKQRLLYQLGLGGPVGNGQQWLSWITLQDHVRAMLWALEGGQRGPINLVAPEPVRNRDFAHDYARSLGRPAWMPFPRLPVAVVLGGDMVDQTIAAGQRVLPNILTQGGFAWDHPTLPDALEWLAGE